MFASAELGHTVDKETYERDLVGLRKRLLDAQTALREESAFPVVIVLSGIEGAGKGAIGNTLNEWLDARYVRTLAFGDREGVELELPPLHRYWVNLPPKGRVATVFGSWYEEPLHARARKAMTADAFEREFGHIKRFETLLAHDGVLLVKLWLHLSRKVQKKRLDDLASKKDTRWRVTAEDRARQARYGAIRSAAQRMLRSTSTAASPWSVIDGSCPRYRELAVARTIVDALEERLAEFRGAKRPRVKTPDAPPLTPVLDGLNVLRALDLDQSLHKKEYEARLAEGQRRLALLLRKGKFQTRSLVCVFEGMDAAGKGGAIRRISAAIDARSLSIVPIAAPTEEERQHGYLWRFYRHLPHHGRVAIFDRSWYGRVLVERVEGFCSELDYLRAYHEIVDFERALVDAGSIVTKFWLQVGEDEQLARFRARKASDLKRFKITEEDWRNRKKSAQYDTAAAEMIERTNLEEAPWTLVEANDKRFARVKILEKIIERLRDEL
jgi:AMP-polyphosphate phosphotransferase